MSRHAAVKRGREHAIVIGASVAGLLAARVLSEFYDEVTVLDRDALPGVLDNRRGVPQGHHGHMLHLGGQEALERLLPGFREDVLRTGARQVRVAEDIRIRLGGYDLQRARIGAGPMPSRRCWKA
jgi:2-polyprenyl-6-methoxyphenol hydroxylase-like FAD-dependent oxidoreductase